MAGPGADRRAPADNHRVREPVSAAARTAGPPGKGSTMTSGRLILAATGLTALATLGPAAGAGATSFTVTAAAAA
jgi:hypothetical protein